MRKILIFLVLSLTLFLTGCNSLDKQIKKVDESFLNIAKEVNYDTVFVTQNEVVLNSKVFNLMDLSYKFLKDNGYKLGKVSKSEYSQIGDVITSRNYIYYSLRYDEKRAKHNQNDYFSTNEKMVVMRMDYTSMQIEILKDVDLLVFGKEPSYLGKAPSILVQIDEKHFLIASNYTYELYEFNDFKLIKTITLNADIKNYLEDFYDHKFGMIRYSSNKYYRDLYYIKGNVLHYYEYKNGNYSEHLISCDCLKDISPNLTFKRLDNKVLLVGVLAFNLVNDSLLDLEKITNEVNEAEKIIPEEFPIYEVQNVKFKIATTDKVEIKLIREDESIDLINLDLLKQNQAYLEITKLLTGNKDYQIEVSNLEYFIFENRLFFHTWHSSSFSGLWNRKSFVFEYDFDSQKLNYVGCIPLYSDIIKIDVID